jgi:tight adherence protein B
MTKFISMGGLSILLGIAAMWMVLEAFFGKNAVAQKMDFYRTGWAKRVQKVESGPLIRHIPDLQIVAIPLALIGASIFSSPKILAGAVLVAALPAILLHRAEKKRNQKFEDDMDGFLVALADSLTAVPNLTEALASLHINLRPPIRDEVSVVLAEVRLGRPIDDALQRMSERIQSSGLDAAVGALILSRRLGGDLPGTLRRIAETIREMARLEGVIKTKTAEGRTQALVIGLMPPGLVLYFEKVNPEWLAPMWNDPIGWLLFGGAAVAEIAALAIIRKIMAVEI